MNGNGKNYLTDGNEDSGDITALIAAYAKLGLSEADLKSMASSVKTRFRSAALELPPKTPRPYFPRL
jgi:hypothetical protein